MPKLLVIENTIVNYGDDRGGVDAAIGDRIEVSKDVATKLINANRALYVSAKDDPTKEGSNTASEAMLKAANDMAKAKAAAEKEAANAEA